MFHTGALGQPIFLEGFVDMKLATLTEVLRYLVFGIFLGSVSVTVVIAAILLAAYNTMSVPDALPAGAQPLIGPLLLLASLLATAPLIGWWYNFLRNLFRIDFTGMGGS